MSGAGWTRRLIRDIVTDTNTATGMSHPNLIIAYTHVNNNPPSPRWFGLILQDCPALGSSTCFFPYLAIF